MHRCREMGRRGQYGRIFLRLGLLLSMAAFMLAGCGKRRMYRHYPELVEESAVGENRAGQGVPGWDLPDHAASDQAAPSQGAPDHAAPDQAAPNQAAPGQESAALADMPALPARYDAREEGRASPVRDQGEFGTCWAFASLSALESRLLPGETWDFSEDHMSHDPNFLLGQTGGGEYTMAMAYLLSWRGPVTEEQDPYGDGESPESLEAVKHVQEIQILPERDFDAVKRAVYEWGGVESSMYSTLENARDFSDYYNPETSAFCYPLRTDPNHDVVIVGWDDDFPKEAFCTGAEHNGAFICESSWGTAFGDDGYFYISYEDQNIARDNIVYCKVEPPENYSEIYQSDLCGWVGQLGYEEETAWAANVYTAGPETKLAAVGFYAIGSGTDYGVYIVRDVPEDPGNKEFWEREKVAGGHFQYPGYYTVPFGASVHLRPGERFAVMVRLVTPGAVHPVAIEFDAGDGKSRVCLDDGEGYVSPDGWAWERAETEQGCNLCLKAYGR